MVTINIPVPQCDCGICPVGSINDSTSRPRVDTSLVQHGCVVVDCSALSMAVDDVEPNVDETIPDADATVPLPLPRCRGAIDLTSARWSQ